MENERRINNPDNFCPEHGKVFRCREGDIMVCLINDCEWTAPARRPLDKEILTLPDVKKEYYG